MPFAVRTDQVWKTSLWAGRVISTLVVLFLLFDGGLKMMRLPAAIKGTSNLGFPVRLVLAIGIAELVCVVLYVIPRTSILGAILLVGYLGGATTAQVRLQDPWFLFPPVIGALVWGGLFFRDPRLRTPLRRDPSGTLTD